MSNISTVGWGTAYDATNWPAEDALPTASLYFLYNDANYAAPASAYQRFEAEGHAIATICVNHTTVANEYDYETGNENDPVPWAEMMRENYAYTGVVYVSTERVQEVLDKFSAASIDPPYFRIANWTGSAPGSVPDYGAGTVGVQYTDQGDGGQVDISLVSPNYPAIGPKIGPTPPPPVSDPQVVLLQEFLNNPLNFNLKPDGIKGPVTKGAWLSAVDAYGNISQGQSGNSVTLVQLMLNTWESVETEHLDADGKFGGLTMGQVVHFQQVRGLGVDGIVGPETKKGLAV